MLVRLQKFLADAGVASRRASEQMILEGRVTVNGEVVRQLGTKIDPARDSISFDGRELRIKRKLYIAINKPPGYISSRKDPLNRQCITDLIPKEWSNLYPVGRLDYDSEGLLFLTNDGQFSLHITHPRYGIQKKYLVSVKGRVEEAGLEPMLKGIFHEGERLKVDRARILKSNNTRTVLELTLSEGKNREVRRICESLRLEVERLQRVQIGPIKLGELKTGKWRTLAESEVKSLISGPPKAKVPSPRREH